jgi:hypothetical protein
MSEHIVSQGQPAVVVHGEYGTSIIVGGPERREKTAAEIAAAQKEEQLTVPLLKALLGVKTDADLDLCFTHGLPKAIGRRSLPKNWWAEQAIYSRKTTLKWKAEQVAVARVLGLTK